MFLARIDGTMTTTVKHETLQACRFLIGQRIDADGQSSGEPIVILDLHAMDFVDVEHDRLPAALLRHQPELRQCRDVVPRGPGFGDLPVLDPRAAGHQPEGA